MSRGFPPGSDRVRGVGQVAHLSLGDIGSRARELDGRQAAMSFVANGGQRVRSRRARLGEPWKQGRRSSAGRRRWTRSCAPPPRLRARSALLCDIDGTISPIAPTPAEAHVPAPFRELLAGLVRRLGLVAFVTGRAIEDGRRMIPLDGAAYIGTHGLETMAADGSITVEPQAERYVGDDPRGRRGGRARPRLRGARRRDRGQAHGARRPLPPGGGHGGHAARDPHARDRAGAGARARHRHRPLRLRGAAAAARSPRGRRCDGCWPPATTSRPWAAATTSPTSPPSPPSATGASATPGARPLAVAAVTDETPRTVMEAADVLVRATPGRPRSARRASARRSALSDRAGARAAPARAPGGRPRQRPPNSGDRFSRNAAMPSVWSSVANASANRSRSMPCPVARSVSAAALTAALQ